MCQPGTEVYPLAQSAFEAISDMHKAEKKFSNIHGISSLLAVWKYTNCSLFGARAHYPHRSLGYIVIAAILVFLIYARLCVCSYASTKEEERITQT